MKYVLEMSSKNMFYLLKLDKWAHFFQLQRGGKMNFGVLRYEFYRCGHSDIIYFLTELPNIS